MELISQSAKKIMEECKEKARAAGLQISGATLEYIVSNQSLIEFKPKIMIPTLYDYWPQDIQVIQDRWLYQIDPHNPYETVINTRPPISFYNDNNPDWLNAMIFYHVLGHIDFFQNNVFFRNTWSDDFCGQALADKRLINRIREEMGAEKRWVDYVIEFAKSVDNLVGYYAELQETNKDSLKNIIGMFSKKSDFYFGKFLKQRHEEKGISLGFYHEELNRYNVCQKKLGPEQGEMLFFNDLAFKSKFPEFNGIFKKLEEGEKPKEKPKDILQHLIQNSAFINKEKNCWMKDVIEVIRKTSLFFQPQIRTKIINEGWASLWHDRLFLNDERMKGNEVDFAIVNSGVLLNPKLGLNPYIIGMNLLEFIEDMAEKGKLSYEYQLLKDSGQRKRFDKKLGKEYSEKVLFETRRNFDDLSLVNFLSEDDFQDFVDKHKLFIAGKRINLKNETIETYVKSKNGKDYRKVFNKKLYHPPHVLISEEKAKEGELYLDHVFEGRALVKKYITEVLVGLAYLAGTKVKLETTEFDITSGSPLNLLENLEIEPEYKKVRVLYACEGGKIDKSVLHSE